VDVIFTFATLKEVTMPAVTTRNIKFLKWDLHTIPRLSPHYLSQRAARKSVWYFWAIYFSQNNKTAVQYRAQQDTNICDQR